MAITSKELVLSDYLRRKVSSFQVVDTMGGVPAYKNNLCFQNEEDLINYIAGKRVLDVGSGFGGLAKDCRLREIDTEIISLNPRLAIPSCRRQERESTQVCVPIDKRMEVQMAHDRGAVSAFAQFLPFSAETFDVVLDSCGALFFATRQDERIQALQEYWRVLRSGGKFRIGWFMGWSHFKWEKQIEEDLGISVRQIFSKNLILRFFGKRAFEVEKPMD